MKDKLTCLRVAIGSIFAIGAVVFVGCGAFYSFLNNWANSPSLTESIRKYTDQVIQTAAFHPGDSADALPSGIVTVCGTPLFEAMKRNNNRYAIVLIDVSPSRGASGAITAAVNVVFLDGTCFEMQYYQYTLVICREIASPTRFF